MLTSSHYHLIDLRNLLLCDTTQLAGGITVPRCDTPPLQRLGIGSGMLAVGLALAWAPGQSLVPRLLGPTLVAMQPFILWAMQPGAARVSASTPAYYIITSLLGGLALVSEVMRLRSAGRAGDARAHHA